MKPLIDLFSIPMSGTHPWDIERKTKIENFHPNHDLNQNSKTFFMVGEIGMDRRISTPIKIQQEIFLSQLFWADEHHKPVLLHCVRAYHDILSILKKHTRSIPIIFHNYYANREITQALLEDPYIFFSLGEHFYLKRTKILNSLPLIPHHRLLLETGAMPKDFNIEDIFQFFCKEKNIPQEEGHSLLSDNINNLFGHDNHFKQFFAL